MNSLATVIKHEKELVVEDKNTLKEFLQELLTIIINLLSACTLY